MFGASKIFTLTNGVALKSFWIKLFCIFSVRLAYLFVRNGHIIPINSNSKIKLRTFIFQLALMAASLALRLVNVSEERPTVVASRT